MASEWSGAALREFQLLFRGGVTSGLTDRQLLERFVDHRDEAAFAALVGRHGPMVWGVCRRLLRDPADAGDAFQATFLVLVRRADSVRVGHSLGPWLYGVSVRVARRARVVANRRRDRERTDAGLPDRPAHDAGPRDDLPALIDEELRRLPARYRSAIILCYLEGLTHEEAAGRLSCPVGTVRSRLARGRDLLRSRLTRRGLAPSVAALAGALAPGSARAAWPEPLFTSTARAAARLAAGQTLAGTVPASVGSLVAGVTRTMMLKKIGLAVSLLAVPLIGLGAALAAQGPGSRAPGTAPGKQAKAAPAEEARQPATAVESRPGEDLTGAPKEEGAFGDFPAFVVQTVPPTGSTDVDPGLAEIRVTFSKPMMDGSWSWVTYSKETFPQTVGKPGYAKDKRTCVMPVKLEAGKTYAVSLNSQKFGNFKDENGRPAVPYLLVFRTRTP